MPSKFLGLMLALTMLMLVGPRYAQAADSSPAPTASVSEYPWSTFNNAIIMFNGGNHVGGVIWLRIDLRRAKGILMVDPGSCNQPAGTPLTPPPVNAAGQPVLQIACMIITRHRIRTWMIGSPTPVVGYFSRSRYSLLKRIVSRTEHKAVLTADCQSGGQQHRVCRHPRANRILLEPRRATVSFPCSRGTFGVKTLQIREVDSWANVFYCGGAQDGWHAYLHG